VVTLPPPLLALSYSVEKGSSDSSQFGLDSEVSGVRLESVGEVDQSTLVEADSVYSRKVDVGSKLRVAIEVEEVVVSV
jgi:hypothetical protein